MIQFDWSNAVNPERADLVFENRNKAYGGYVLRQDYRRRVALALIISLGAIFLMVAVPLISSFISDNLAKKEITRTDEVIMDAPPIDKTAPPPPPPIPPPPVKETIKFTPPKVVKDEEVQEPPPTQEEVKDVTVSTVTQEGEKDLVDLPPDNPVVGDPNANTIFTVVEEMPAFPGGDSKLLEYIRNNIKYPSIARENNIQGRVFVTFVVDKDGKVKDAKVVRGIGGGCDEEALRVVKSLPEWKPGRQNGRNVMVQFTLPVNFTLQ
jgi:periplasmic protein TonB